MHYVLSTHCKLLSCARTSQGRNADVLATISKQPTLPEPASLGLQPNTVDVFPLDLDYACCLHLQGPQTSSTSARNFFKGSDEDDSEGEDQGRSSSRNVPKPLTLSSAGSSSGTSGLGAGQTHGSSSSSFQWDVMILDEGHKIKNPKMKLVRSLCVLHGAKEPMPCFTCAASVMPSMCD